MASSSSTQAAPPAAAVSDDTDIDVETIQSTVDMSMSLALSLVQTWMPSSLAAPLNQSVVQSRKRLEEYMRRPPRLGVGTPIPTAQNAQLTHHETQKLKNRLVGSGAARRKAQEETMLNVAGSKRPGGTNDDEDESESRGKGGKHSKVKSEDKLQSQDNTIAVTSITALSPRQRTPLIPTSPTSSPSSTLKTSPEPIPAANAGTERNSSPYTGPSVTQATPDEPMGIHKLPAKLPLAAKIWPQSPPQNKRRKTLAAMLPPPSPSHNTWSMVLPRLPPSRSASESVASSSVPSSSATTEPGPDSATRLSRKERKRLRKAALQTETQETVPRNYQDHPSDRGSMSESKSQGAHVPSPDTGAVAMKATSTPRHDSSDADSDDSDRGDEELEEMVSRASDEHSRVGAQDDTVQDGGKKKRKRRTRKNLGPAEAART
ncbi:hypothetical protein RhiXN_04364 [Rhizoctonia solani]|uniref:Uncharacterized protein n=1 Tax=Rhizoctonia solani TaxID=456999 RepID=A0A8H8STS6_9AGAM|nr:uncharacterized protein RhiXN_04364 [Rhizoctonia solani]QRW16363.1 hypothetical protein RhiXN_04364 [Rhizoctonia solani]